MRLTETEAIVLRNYNLSDADKIIVFMTQENGLVRGVAKGAKRLKSKFGSALEPFTIVSLSFDQKDERELVYIKQIELLQSFFKNTSQIDFLSKFEYFAELLINFAPPHDPNTRLYNMSKICLETASKYPENLESIMLYFEIWLLSLCGFLPSWEVCDQCKRILNNTELTNFQFDNHLVCGTCQKYKKHITVTAMQRNLYIYAQKMSPIKFIEHTFEKNTELRSVSQIVKRIISKTLGKESVGEKILTAKY